MVKQIKKRDGRVVSFNQGKIAKAINKALIAIRGVDDGLSDKLSDEVVKELNRCFKNIPGLEY
ncbi:hypothetical protein GF352_02175 [archaeon]|nr:hypothetical protein [archaeon]